MVKGFSIEPPKKRQRIGKPKIKITKEQGEKQGAKKAIVRCGNCKELGHNRRA